MNKRRNTMKTKEEGYTPRHNLPVYDKITGYEKTNSGPIALRPDPVLVVRPPNVSPRHLMPFFPSWSSNIVGGSSTEATTLGQGLGGSAVSSNGDGQRSGEMYLSSPLPVSGRKLPDMDDIYPNGVFENTLSSDVSFKTEQSEAGMDVNAGDCTRKADYCRHKYDDLIDPNLSSGEKKKQRRILANRASARRSRERKKLAMSHHIDNERRLKHERDVALAAYEGQARLLEELSQQLEATKRELEFCRAAANGATPFPAAADKQHPPIISPFADYLDDECVTSLSKADPSFQFLDNFYFRD